MFQALEEQDRFLSSMSADGEKLRSVVDQIFEDLNNYCECFIPIDGSNTINIKLFPLHPAPPQIRAFHVPISTVRLRAVMDVNWDPTMEKIVDHIDGINSVRQISSNADTDYNLTRKCIQHLMYYNCVIIVDIFQFSNRYAVTPDISAFVTDQTIADECQSYVAALPPRHPSTSATTTTISPSLSSSSTTSSATFASSSPNQRSSCDLLNLYCSLNSGLTVKEWYFSNRTHLRGIDIRRFISFGIIKGLIYRVNTFSILENPISSEFSENIPSRERRMRKLSRRMKHFDHICTDLQVSSTQALNTLKKYGDVILVHA